MRKHVHMIRLQGLCQRLAAAALAMVCGLGVVCGSAIPAQARAATGHTVVVIDPGHGGSEMGAAYAPYGEKELTLYVSQLIMNELMLYDNVDVYMTRAGDYDVSIGQRVNYAQSVNADLLYSVHFNASGITTVKPQGSLMLISAFGSLYATEAQLGLLNLQQLQAVGLKSRGFLTKLGRSGADYYGIVRRAAAIGMPAMIAEQCYLDNETDRTWLAQANSYVKLAHADATAIAEYLHLKSTYLGVDYTNYVAPAVEVPTSSTTPVMIAPLDSNLYYGY